MLCTFLHVTQLLKISVIENTETNIRHLRQCVVSASFKTWYYLSLSTKPVKS